MAKIESLSELDEYYEQKEFEEKMSKTPNKILAIVIIIIISIILGLAVFFLVNSLVNKQEEKPPEDFIGESIDLNDDNVQILYQYVTYGAEGTRYLKYVNNREVDLTSFTTYEKMYYALQFLQVEDLEFTGKLDSAKHKIYTVPDSTLEKYMKLYFGNSVMYEPEPSFEYPFSFSINKMNVGKFTYNNERGEYDAVFASYYDIKEQENTVQPVYGKLINALRQPDGSIVLQERVVYTELRTDNGMYAVDIYKDPEKTDLIDTRSSLTDADLSNFQVDVTTYSKTAIVEYTFAWNGQNCSFKSSRIII